MRFRQDLKRVQDVLEDYKVKERAQEVASFGFEAAKGALSKPQMEALEAAANAESARAEAEYKRQSLEHRVRKDAAEAEISEVELEIRKQELVAKRIENRLRLEELHKRLGVVPLPRPDGSWDVIRVEESAIDAKKLEGDHHDPS